MEDKAAYIRSLGLPVSNDLILDTLRKFDENVERAVDFLIDSGLSNQSDLAIKSPQRLSLKHGSKMLVGRRNVQGYSIASGFLLRHQYLRFTVEATTTHSVSSAKTSKAFHKSNSASHIVKKDKFSGGKMFFDTYFDASCGENRHHQERDVRGRLPNMICDFLVPLAVANLIEIKGHVAYDFGHVGTFQNFPVSIYVFVTEEFIAYYNLKENTVKGGRSSGDHLSSLGASESEHVILMNAINDLLIWLNDGEEGLTQQKQQRDRESTMTSLTKKEDGTASNIAKSVDDQAVVDAEQQDCTMAIDEFLDRDEADANRLKSVEKDGEEAVPAAFASLFQSSLKLKSYQVQGMEWMLERERSHCDDKESRYTLEELAKGLGSMPHEGMLSFPSQWDMREYSNDNPLWQPVIGVTLQGVPLLRMQEALGRIKGDASFLRVFWWNRFSQIVQHDPPAAPVPCRGGILAHEMGMGKTIMTMGLISASLAARKEKAAEVGDKRKAVCLDLNDDDFEIVTARSSSRADKVTAKDIRRGGTLIVCPLTLMEQWMAEFRTKLQDAGGVKMLMYYGAERQQSLLDALWNQDIVVTSYGMLTSDARNHHNNSGAAGLSISRLLNVHWSRVVLDEAHTIKNAATEVAKACTMLKADCRWALTGTPIQNSLEDLYSLIKFLKHEPWNQARWFRRVIIEPHAQENPQGMTILRGLLKEIMCRRTKDERDKYGNLIVALPDKKYHQVAIDLSSEEREFYKALLNRSQAVARSYDDHLNAARKINKYATLFTLLMRLRQACNHPFLIIANLADKEEQQGKQQKLVGFGKAVKEVVNLEVEEGDGLNNGEFEGLLGKDFLNAIYARLRNSLTAAEVDRASPVLGRPLSRNDSAKFVEEVYATLEQYLPEEQQQENIDNSNRPDAAIEPASALSRNSSKSMECLICFEERSMDAFSITSCGHIVCMLCLESAVEKIKACPLCMCAMQRKDIVSLANLQSQSKPVSRQPSTISLTSTQMEEPVKKSRSNSSSSSGAKQQHPEAGKGRYMNLMVEESQDKDETEVAHPAVVERASTTVQEASTAWRLWGKQKFVKGTKDNNSSNSNSSNGQQYKGLDWHSSSKITGLMDLLYSVWNATGTAPSSSSKGGKGHTTKVVLFSQWTSMLDIIEHALGHFNHDQHYTNGSQSRLNEQQLHRMKTLFRNYRRLDGTMSQSHRAEAVHSFNSDPAVSLFLISLRAGGVGLNLTSASAVILVDPWWNPSIEEQAIDRIHRLGQTREVNVYRLICKDTVEERLLRLQEAKRRLTQQAIGTNKNAFTESKLSLEELKEFFR